MKALCLLFTAVLLMAPITFGATLPEIVDAFEKPEISVADAKADLISLRDQINSSYYYKKFYEARYRFDFNQRIELKLQEVDQLAVGGRISNADLRALVSESISVFRDAHTWISTKGNSTLSLNIGLTFGELEREYLMYKGNPEIYAQLGIADTQEFEKEFYTLKALNGIPMNRVANAFTPILAYSNSLTRHSYAGILLSSSKGLLYLSSLMKRGRFPMPPADQDGIQLTLVSKRSGETKVVTVHPQQLADYGTDDLIGKVEGRSANIFPTEETPAAYAKAYGWKFEEIRPGIFSLTVPSWAGDLIHKGAAVPSRRALYQFVVDSMTKLRASPNAELILDVRGNRGGDVILWQPIIQLLMGKKAQVTGVIELNDEAMKTYSRYRDLTTDQSLDQLEHRDYLNYAYAYADTDLNPDVRAAVDRESAYLKQIGKMSDERIGDDARFSRLLYVTTEKKDAGNFNGKVSVLADRYSFSANDTFVAALRAVIPAERLTVYGERPEGGSGTAGHIVLPSSKISVPSGTFASFNVDGEMFETDFEKPDVQLKLPLTSYFERQIWYLKQVVKDIANGRDTRAKERAKEKVRRQNALRCQGAF